MNIAHIARNIRADAFVRRIRKQGRMYRYDDDVDDTIVVGIPFGFDLTVPLSSSSLVNIRLLSPSCGPLTGTALTTILLWLILIFFPPLLSVVSLLSAKRPEVFDDRCVNTLPLIVFLLYYHPLRSLSY